jgi:hypothetical protein
MTRVPGRIGDRPGWSAATELGADFPVPRDNYREILSILASSCHSAVETAC